VSIASTGRSALAATAIALTIVPPGRGAQQPPAVVGPAKTKAARPGTAVPAGAPSAVRGVVTVAGAKSNGGAVVTLEAPGLKPPPPLAEPAKIDQKGFRFLPHVTVVPAGSAVRFLNNDPEPHNVYSPEGRYNLGTWPTGDTRDHVFAKPGIYSQLCNIHPDMLAFVVVVATPLYAVTDEAGNYVIRNVPAGTYTLSAWHPKKDGLEREVTVEAGKPLKLDLTLDE
jgi:plastocyanin